MSGSAETAGQVVPDDGTTCPELARTRAGDDPARVAIRVDGTRELSAGQWLEQADALARGLVARGAGPGVRVAVRCDDWLDYAVSALAVYLSGATLVGLGPGLSPQETSRRLTHCGVSGIVHAGGVEAPGFEGWTTTPARDARTGPARFTDPGPDDLAEIIHTSGTTGRAKPVAVPQANLTFGQSGGGRLPGAAISVFAPVRPGTNAGHSAVLYALTSGATVHLLSDPRPETIAAAMADIRVGMVILPAPLATRLVVTGLLEDRDLSSVPAVMLGSAPAPTATVHHLRRLLPGATLSIGYGSTEAAPASTWLSGVDGTEPAGTLGGSRPGVDVEIRDDGGTPLGPGEVGHIWLRSPAPPRRYYRLDDGTFRDGWTRMGDLGTLDGDGAMCFFDRTADAVVLDGRRMSTFQVEDALHWHPAVADASVVHLPDADGGRLVAAVELREPVDASALTAHLHEQVTAPELRSRDRLEVLPVTSLPRGGLDKVLKRRLRESLSPASADR
jgi:acyl-CoA synthetase (AMP-forming)/AMP-acid ligase II